MTVVIPSYQRREAVCRLVAAIGDEVRSAPDVGAGLDIVVVVDGSTDGSVEALKRLDVSVPLTVHHQPNRGLAAARNTGLSLATGEVVLFLDDDMVPSRGLLARHRGFHEDAPQALLMGPCRFTTSARASSFDRSWADEWYSGLAARGEVGEAEAVSFANTSGPAALFAAVGGFDERFVGWGGEDYELGLRMLKAGVRIAYDDAAVAWHEQERDLADFLRTKREQARNMVRIVDRHPDEAAALFRPLGHARRLTWLRRLPSPAIAAIASLVAAAARASAAVGVAEARVVSLAVEVNLLAGVVEQGGDRRLVDLLLGTHER